MKPDAYPHPVERVHFIETHVSWVLLAGEYAYKIKRPVCYAFVDMRTEAQRHFFCREELRLNRRFAPELYLDVVQIARADGGVQIGGSGEVIEHAVCMRQFDTREELDRLLAEARVEPRELAQFGERLARIHQRFPPINPGEQYGTFGSVSAVLCENVSQVESASRGAGLDCVGQALGQAMRERLDEVGALIDARHAGGRVRECHGDLHCRNVVRSGGRLVAFDGLEFEPAFRWIDVAEEIAFLFMDLGRRGGGAHANAFANGYLGESGDYEAARLLRMYGAHRALVRAKVAALEAQSVASAPASGPAPASPSEAAKRSARQSGPHASEHRAYIECAQYLLAPRRPALILMSGLSGSGKTWLAQRLAGRIGAIHVRSDVERKRLAGLAAHDSSQSGVGQGLYAPDANERTYERLARCASDILRGGFPALVDATFQRRADRTLFSRLAADLGLRVILIRCHAPDEVLRSRILDRARQAKDASEANLAVLDRQQARYEPVDPSEELELVEADTTRETIVEEVEIVLKAR
jgi:aminoglycoside phosphotransferase family enzyme/predicted kinase